VHTLNVRPVTHLRRKFAAGLYRAADWADALGKAKALVIVRIAVEQMVFNPSHTCSAHAMQDCTVLLAG
jgi:hypothetical protein